MNGTGPTNAVRRGIFLVVTLLALLTNSSSAQGSKLLTMVSPKLRRFLSDNPGASITLSNAIYGSFGAKSVALRYFYSDDDAEARAFHTYPDESSVCITVRENQLPIDEFICLIFEAINSKSEKGFKDLYRDAQAGVTEKEQFVRGILRLEFDAVKQVRDLLKTIRVDAEGSYYFDRFVKCPDEFEDFLHYAKKVSRELDPMAEYEMQYEAIRKKQAAPPREDRPKGASN